MYVVPSEVVGLPELRERGIGGIGEAVPIAELVEAALALHGVTEVAELSHAVHLPRHRLLERQVVIGGGSPNGGIPSVADREEELADHVERATGLLPK